MNDTTYSSMNFAFMVVITVFTLAYTFWSTTEWPDRYELVPSAATVFVEQTEIPQDVLWTGAQVVAKLYQLGDDEHPNLIIDVDGRKFETEEDVKLNQYVVSLSSNYTQKLILDGTGQVTQILFRKGV